jgi:WD40 repeat protein
VSTLRRGSTGSLVPLGAALGGHTGDVTALAFAPGAPVLTSGDGTTARVWSLPGNGVLPGGWTDSAAITPNGRTLVTGSNDASGQTPTTVRLWDLTGAHGPAPLGKPIPGQAAKYSLLAISPDGRTLATADPHNAVRLRSLSDPAHPGPLGAPFGGQGDGIPLTQLAFSPTGHTLWSLGPLTTVHLWDVSDPAHPRALPWHGPATGLGRLLAFSPDGRLAAAASDPDQRLALWDVSDPSRPRKLGTVPLNGTYGTAAAFSPDGRRLLTADGRHTLRLWDVSDPGSPKPLGGALTGHTDEIEAVAFAPHTPLAASTSADGTLRLWDLSDPHHPKPEGSPLPTDTPSPLAFTPNGRTILTAGPAGTLRPWPLTPRTAITRICATTSGVLTHAVWSAHAPGIPYAPGCATTG